MTRFTLAVVLERRAGAAAQRPRLARCHVAIWCTKTSDTSLLERLTLAVVLEQRVGAAAQRPRLRTGAADNVVRAPPRLPDVLQVVVVPRQIQLDSVLFQQRLHPSCAKTSLRKIQTTLQEFSEQELLGQRLFVWSVCRALPSTAAAPAAARSNLLARNDMIT